MSSSKAEWEILATFIESDQGVSPSTDERWFEIAPYLKSAESWEVSTGIGNLDSYGFSAKAAGHRFPNESFGGKGLHTYWWTSTQQDAYYAHRWYLEHNTDFFKTLDNDLSNAFSIRCLED